MRRAPKPKCSCGAEVAYTALGKPRKHCDACAEEKRKGRHNERRRHLHAQRREAKP